MAEVNKDRPEAAWIESLRSRYPCEAEIDRVLTRKMHRRAGPGYSPVSLETLVNGVEALLRTQLATTFEVLDPRWLSGGASKVQMAFWLNWEKPGLGRTRTRMVLRMEPAESIVETSRLREFQLIKAMEPVVPVPPCYWADAEGQFLPYPAIIYGFAEGVTKPTGKTANVAGLGTNFGPELRSILGTQFIDHLSKIHTCDWRGAELTAFDHPALGTEAVELQLNCWARVWEEDSREDIPLLRVAEAWLRQNMPPVDRLSVVHGDYRAGNFLYTEHDNRISAWLDWELGHLGDRHDDLAFTTNAAFGHMAEDGKTFLVDGLMPQDAFFEAYEKASGLSVNLKTVDYYRIYNSYKLAVLAVGTTYRAVHGGKTHQDIVLSWVTGAGYLILEELRATLEKVA